MKNLLIIFLSIVLFSCDDFVDETPKGNLIPKTVDDFGQMLDDFDPYNGNMIAWGPGNTILMTDDSKLTDATSLVVRLPGVSSYKWDEYMYESTENDKDWNAFYHVIYLCNYILENIDTASEGASFDRDIVKGSALVNRAYAYFSLVNLYAKHYDTTTATTDLGVPMPLNSDINIKYGRSSVEDVYIQIQTDLETATPLLGVKIENNYSFRPTRQGAYAFLSRLYLYKGEYEKALKNADEVKAIRSDLFDYNELSQFVEGQPDFGFENWAEWEGWKISDVLLFRWENTFTDQYFVSDELFALYDQATDLRFKNFFTNFKYYSFSTDPNGYRFSDIGDVNRGFSLGEVYLIEAEAKVREGDVNGALTALNALRSKRYVAGSPEIVESDSENLLRIILEERRRETRFMGLRWFDLKRLNKDDRFKKTITHTLFGETYTLEPGDNRYVLAIPRNVIELNPLIEQNPR